MTYLFYRRSRSRSRSRSRGRDCGDGGGGDGGAGQQKGIACRWNDRGFGFIKPNDGSEDVFCHFSSIKDGSMLREGDEVEFESVYDHSKGKSRAENVTGGCQDEGSGKSGSGSGSGYDGGGGGGLLVGTASRWNDRGFGFIKPADGSEDVFCHFSAITDGKCLREGSEVRYEKSYDEQKGNYRATNVTGGVREERG